MDFNIGDKIKYRLVEDSDWEGEVFTVVPTHPKGSYAGKCAVAYDDCGEYSCWMPIDDPECEYKLVEAANEVVTDTDSNSPLKVQYGGTHYKDKAIQPIEYILANDLNFCEGNAIKYLTRWRQKGGIEDLKKAKHYIDFLIEKEEQK